jgi:hypothetical protein
MLTITKFPYKTRCDVNKCSRRGEWSVGEEYGPKATRFNYCEEHLIELAKEAIELFPDKISVPEVVQEFEPVTPKALPLTVELKESSTITWENNNTKVEDMQKEIDELKAALQVKTTAHECLKEQIEELRKEVAAQKAKSKPKSTITKKAVK